jgi:tetratricopeptide (TPR) repeat protein
MAETLADAVSLHQQGRLPEAAAAYRAALARDPNQPDALAMLGIVALQTGRSADAIKLLQAAIAIAPRQPHYHFNLGAAFGQSGQPDQAIAAFDQALARQPAYPEALTAKATALLALGRLPEARTALREAIRLRPGHTETMHRAASVALAMGDFQDALDGFTIVANTQPNFALAYARRALALGGLNRPAEALLCFDRALALHPADADTLANRALALSRLGRFDDALAGFDAALRLSPRHVRAMDNRGTVLLKLGRHQEALDSHAAALRADPSDAAAHNHRGVVLHALHRDREALAAYNRALALNSDDAEAHNNRATALQALDHHGEALAAYDRAISLRPDYADALGNRGVLLQMTGRAHDAIASFDAALTIRPNDAHLRFTASLCRLLLGDHDTGWRDFEHRWDHPLMAADQRDFAQPRWRGEPTGTVLLHAEQGFGDTLQFCRYVPLVADRGVRVVLEVQPALVRLLRRLDARITVIARGETPPPFDWHCPLLSLPLTLRVPILPADGYLRADPDRVSLWRHRLAPHPGRKIGLVWAGSPRHHSPVLRAADRGRSLELHRLEPLATVPDTIFVSLQKGEPAAQARTPKLPLLDYTGELDDFDDTAALVAALDLVISVDTAMVHLAGGLGAPVWMLNRYDTCWRWLLDRTDSPWYPSARLFRQPALGDWDSVIAAVAAAART